MFLATLVMTVLFTEAQQVKYNGIDNDIEEIAGVSILKPHFTSNSMFSLATNIREIPESGIYVYSKDNKTYFPVFYKKNNNGEYVVIESAEDYPYYDHMSYEHRATYFPYKKGIYYALKPEDRTQDGDIFVAYGEVTESGGRLPNCSLMDVLQDSRNGTDPKFIFRDGVTTTLSRFDFYGSILRLEDVDKIVAAPYYSLFYSLYKINDEKKTIELVEEKCAAADYNVSNDGIAGFSLLDFSDYNFKGYILLGIRAATCEKVVGEQNIHRFSSAPVGMLNLFNDAQKMVYVQWKKNVSVTYDSKIPTKVKNNIDVIINNTFAPDLMATINGEDGGYSNWSMADKDEDKRYIPIPAMGKVNGWWYCGSNEYNVPLMHVNPISYITASKNRHSRVYVARGPHSGTSGATSCNNLYGSVCSSTVGLLLGLPAGYDTADLVSEFQKDLFTFRNYETCEDLQPGDLLGRMNFGNGGFHVIYVAEVVSINGEIFSINAFEGNPPIIGWDFYINHKAHADYSCPRGTNIMNFKSSKKISYSEHRHHIRIARPKKETIKTIQEAYGPYDLLEDYPVSEIMCDRGTDAVYCLGEYLGLTVTDSTISSIKLVKDGDTTNPILFDLAESRTINSYSDGQGHADMEKVYDICDAISDYGYYEVYLQDYQDITEKTRKESFYIAKPRKITREIVDDGKNIIIRFDPDEVVNGKLDEVKSFGISYQLDEGVDRERWIHYYVVNQTLVDGKCQLIIPRRTVWADNKERTARAAVMLRRTPYGTYRIRLNLKTNNQLQRAGGENQ